ncbi:flap endonuclease [Guyparkeria sp. SB14A]|uniref:5'-3' exonuclease n=1 Tax=Guyparkeria sp. SB14A TaxID=2571147 RepID=UPI0010ABCC83|nr:5'-3' exonuclease H3TH domain-containing protein [Guyparkeria sp. SB14A]TKA88298.1 flap endonuclease [Guyparkeria sp. SB14A]
MTQSRAWLIDAHAQIWRAWHVYDKERTDRAGRPVNALLGFADYLLALLESTWLPNQPAPIIAAIFDAPCGRGHRQAIYPDYKGHRPPHPTDLTEQFPRCRDLAAAAGFGALDHAGFEADDVIGTLVGRLRNRERAVTIVTGDKDLAQLLGPDDRWYNPMRGSVMAYGDVERRFGVRPAQIADWLALTGDVADNIPGVPGIGPRTAARLLRKHGCIDGIYDNLSAVYGMKFRGAPRAQRLLQEHEDQVRLSRRLTEIVCDLPLAETPQPWRGIDRDALVTLLDAAGADPAQIELWEAWNAPLVRSA